MDMQEEDIKLFNRLLNKAQEHLNNIKDYLRTLQDNSLDVLNIYIAKPKIFSKVVYIDQDLADTQINECWDILNRGEYTHKYFSKCVIDME
jgi:hypothetical protein